MSITEPQLAAKFKTSGRNWDQLCQAGVVNGAIWSGGFVGTYPSAIAAYHDSKIVSKDASKAPINAVHYWAIGKYGHVAGQLSGNRIWMCSKYVDKFWGTNVGTTTVAAYTKRTGARYLGWSYSNGKNKLHITAPAKKPAKKPTTGSSSKPATKKFVLTLPEKAIQVRVQKALRALGLYSGPANGFGPNTFKAIQKALSLYAGYKGPIDGLIQERGAYLIQTYARDKGGYTGKVDKLPAHNSWTGFARALEKEV